MLRALNRAGARPDVERWALLGAVITAVLCSLTATFADPPYVTGDEAPHVDYAYQLWHGRLPVFEEGLVLRPDGAWLAPVQWTAQHPPLFYLLVAPLVGPLADAGHPVAAVYAARAVNSLLHGALVLVTWWTVRQLARPGSALPIVTALVMALAAAAARLGGSAYNDLLAAVLAALLLGLCARIVRDGPTTRLVAAVAVVAALCSVTRTSATVVAAVCCTVALLAAVLRSRRDRRAAGPTIALALGAPVAVLAASGWFYLRNLRLTGNLTGSHYDWATENQGREIRTLAEVLADPITWGRLPDLFWWAGPRPTAGYEAVTMTVTTVLLVWVPVLLGAAWLVRRVNAGARARAAAGAPSATADRVLLLALPAVAFAVASATQLIYATNGGGLYPRYLLPVAVPLTLAVAAGLLVRPRLLVPAWTGLVLVDLAVWVGIRLTTPVEPGRYTSAPVPAVAAAVLAVVAGAISAWLVLRTVRAYATAASTAATAADTTSTSSSPA